MISGVFNSQSSPSFAHTGIGVDVDRGATCVKVVSQELRPSMVIEMSGKFTRSRRTACLHVWEARYGIMVVAHLRVQQNDRASSTYNIPPPSSSCAVRLQVLPPMKEHGLCLSLRREKPPPRLSLWPQCFMTLIEGIDLPFQDDHERYCPQTKVEER